MKCLKIIVVTFIFAVIAFVTAEIYFFKETNSPQNINYQLEKSIYYYQKGNYIKSVKYLQALNFAYDLKNISCLNKVAFLDTIGAHKKSIEVIKNKLKENPNNRVLNAMLGMKYLADKNYSEAEKYIIKSATYENITSYTYSRLGDFYYNFNEPKRAVVAYTESIKLIPKLKTKEEKTARLKVEHLHRADAYRQAGDYKNALEDYKILLKQDLKPCMDPSRIYYLVSICKYKLGDLDASLVAIDKAISMSNKPYPQYLMQKSYIYYGRKEYEKFDLLIDEALKHATSEEKKEIIKIRAKMDEYRKLVKH